jgi:Exostosin family
MARSVYLVNSHRWLHERLSVGWSDADEFESADTVDAADLIIYPVGGWPDPEASEGFLTLPRGAYARTYVFSLDEDPVPWAPGMYVALPRSRERLGLAGGFHVAPHHFTPGGLGDYLRDPPVADQDLLWSFVGSVKTAPKLRRAMMSLRDDRALQKDTPRWSDVVRWDWQDKHKVEARRFFRDYVESIIRSKFVLCPRGFSPSSYRIFEAMQLGRCPVVISDDWLPPRYVDWGSCAVFVRESDIMRVPELLRGREADAESLGRNARRQWDEFFAPSRMLRTLVRTCVEIDASFGGRRLRRVSLAARACVTLPAFRRGKHSAARFAARIQAKPPRPRYGAR